jgi:hypothetical protein
MHPPIAIPALWPSATPEPSPIPEPGGPVLQRWFTPDGTRYAMDFAHCGYHSDWYQVDTEQDATYYGTWANPVTRQLLTYCEGDITLTQFPTPTQYATELAAAVEWQHNQGYAAALDDHDGRHATKLSA